MTRAKFKFTGSMVALVTPFRDGLVDYPAIQKLIEFHLKESTDAIVPCGTTGEASTLTIEEHCDVMSYVVQAVNRRLPVICGAGSNNTEEAVYLAQHAKKIKADGVLAVTPYYNKPTQEGMIRHFEYLAKKADIPIVLYNVPSRTGVSLAAETVERLAKVPGIVAIKEASGNLELASQIIARSGIILLSGEDSLTLPLMAVGAQGVISVTANVAPSLTARMVHAALKGDYGLTRRLHYQLFALSKMLFVETNPIPVKTALAFMGKIREEFRLPLCEMGQGNRSALRQLLKQMRLI